MKKMFHIFITLTLLIVGAIGNVGVFKCLIDGSFSITKTCCPQSISEEVPDCCASSNDPQESTFEQGDSCCVDVDLETDFINDVLPMSEDADVIIESDQPVAFHAQFYDQLNNKTVIIRGPPPNTQGHLRVSTPLIFKQNCTFLC